MGRVIRRVSENWEHPQKQGGYIPLQDNYISSLEYYKEDVLEFIFHMTEVLTKSKTKIYEGVFTEPGDVYNYLIEELQAPNISDYMPKGEWYQLYEDVSEGTPLSPPFATKRELIKWLTENKDFRGVQWNKDGAKDVVESGDAPSGVFTNGKVYKPEEQYLIK